MPPSVPQLIESARNRERGLRAKVAIEDFAVIADIWMMFADQAFLRPICSPKSPLVPTRRLTSGFCDLSA